MIRGVRIASLAVAPVLVALAPGVGASGLRAPTAARATAAPVAPGDAAAVAAPRTRYEMRAVHDPEGTGRFYVGREIAQVMGSGGAAWLERPERAAEERPEAVLAALALGGDETVADLGAGSGYFAFRIAPLVPRGRVLAVDVSDEMLELVRRRASRERVGNVATVRARERDPGLAPASVDAVLMVDVYHELYWPYEVMTRVRESLRPGGRLVVVEYRREDPRVPIKDTHRMTAAQVRRELGAVGFVHVRTLESTPLQHVIVFRR